MSNQLALALPAQAHALSGHVVVQRPGGAAGASGTGASTTDEWEAANRERLAELEKAMVGASARRMQEGSAMGATK